MSELVFDQRSNSWLEQDQMITNFLVFRILRISPAILPDNFITKQFIGHYGWTNVKHHIKLFDNHNECGQLIKSLADVNNSYFYDFTSVSIIKYEIEETVLQLSEL